MTGLSLTMHPASEGDALILQWGDRRALIDLGRTADYRALRPVLEAAGRFDLFVMTHVDADHIEGAMPLVRAPVPPFAPDDVWFNGYAHLRAARARRAEMEVLSIRQGEKLSAGIRRFCWRWNGAFGGGPVSTDSPEAAAPIDVAGLAVTLLGPSDAELSALERVWDAALAVAALREEDPDEAPTAPAGFELLSPLNVAELAARPFRPDTKEPNGSSIAFLAEFAGRRVLLAGDAHAGTLESRLARLGYGPGNRLRVDLFKLSHHGSKGNLSPALLAMIDCTRFAISTDGSRHGHPDRETIARILAADPGRDKVFYFNTRQPAAEIWDSAALQSAWRYRVEMPAEGAPQRLCVDV